MAMFCYRLPPEFRFQIKVFLFWTSFSFYLKYNYDKFMALILAVSPQWCVLHTWIYDSSKVISSLVSLENPSLHSCLESKFLLRGYYVGDGYLCMLFPFITYFTFFSKVNILVVQGSWSKCGNERDRVKFLALCSNLCYFCFLSHV